MLWFVIGIVVAVGLTLLVPRLRSRGIAVTWYQWLIGVIGLLLIVGAIQHDTASRVEGYPGPGLMGALVFGLPGLILLAIVWQLIARRQQVS